MSITARAGAGLTSAFVAGRHADRWKCNDRAGRERCRLSTPVNPPRSLYRREGDHWLIEVKLRELRQLFHHLDPAPFREKDLDPAAETYIVDAFRDLGVDKPARLIVHLPAAEAKSADALTLPSAVSNYFAYRATQMRMERQRLLRRGVGNLATGLAFLFVCLSLRGPVSALGGGSMLAEGLLIIGWVALWRPVEIFLYDAWPLLRQQRRLEALSRMPVEVREAGALVSAG